MPAGAQARRRPAVDPSVARSSAFLGLLALVLTAGTAAARESGPQRPGLAAGSAEGRGGVSVAGPGGAEWALPGGPRVIAAPGAALRVLHTPQPLRFGPGPSVAGYTLLVRSGNVEVVVPPRAKSAVVVVAPRQLGAIVQSGAFQVAATPTSTAVANLRGESTVSVGGGAFRALASNHVYVASGVAGETRQLVSAPKNLRGKRVVITLGERGQLGALSWNRVVGATGYRAELREEKTGKLLASADAREPGVAGAFEPQPIGKYVLRVYSLDPSGIPSAKPLEAPVRVVGMELPPGAYADSSGAVRVGVGQRVRFRGADGLEMTYGGADRFVRASETVGLYRNDRTVVHLRVPGSRDFATARLLPRTVRARIELGPSRAVWPKDPVQIRVRLEDPSGEPVPESIRAKPRVQVGIRDVDVSFTSERGWLHGTVQPQAGPGPWVVRVAVEDEHAQPLGYEHLEIIREKAPRTRLRPVPPRVDAVSRR